MIVNRQLLEVDMDGEPAMIPTATGQNKTFSSFSETHRMSLLLLITNSMLHRLCEKFNNLLPVTISDSLSQSMTNVRVIIFVSDKLDDTKELTFDHLAFFHS